MTKELKHIIESLLFAAEEPLSINRIKNLSSEFDTKAIKNALSELLDEYKVRQGGFFLCEVAGGYQFRSRPEYAEWIKRLLSPSSQRISRAAMETLAIVAYKQPVIRSDIEHVRGVEYRYV